MIQVFAESQDYGIHGERVRNACWGYLCQSGAMELKEVRDGYICLERVILLKLNRTVNKEVCTSLVLS